MVKLAFGRKMPACPKKAVYKRYPVLYVRETPKTSGFISNYDICGCGCSYMAVDIEPETKPAKSLVGKKHNARIHHSSGVLSGVSLILRHAHRSYLVEKMVVRQREWINWVINYN